MRPTRSLLAMVTYLFGHENDSSHHIVNGFHLFQTMDFYHEATKSKPRREFTAETVEKITFPIMLQIQFIKEPSRSIFYSITLKILMTFSVLYNVTHLLSQISVTLIGRKKNQKVKRPFNFLINQMKELIILPLIRASKKQLLLARRFSAFFYLTYVLYNLLFGPKDCFPVFIVTLTLIYC